MQNEITTSVPLLNAKGQLTESGWARQPHWMYQRSQIRGRLQLAFQPILDRSSSINLLILRSEQHQFFGYFRGRCELDDGRIIDFENLLGFAEDVYNRF